MWRIFLGLVSHRALLILVAMTSLYIQTLSVGTKTHPNPHHSAKLWPLFIEKVFSQPEAQIYNSAQTSTNPFLWFVGFANRVTKVPAVVLGVILANLFFILYLSELHAVFSRMCTEEIAVSSTLLAVMWPSTIAFHFGNPFVYLIFLITWCVRAAMDNQWLIAGGSLALAMLIDPLSLAIFPLIAYIFWYFQRHFLVQMVLKRGAFLFVPVLFVIIWKFPIYLNFKSLLMTSAFFKIAFGDSNIGAFSAGLIFQTLTALMILVGGVAAGISNSLAIHRVIPIYFTFFFFVFSSYGNVVQRAPLAGITFQGISGVLAPLLMKIFQSVLVYFACYRVFDLFKF